MILGGLWGSSFRGFIEGFLEMILRGCRGILRNDLSGVVGEFLKMILGGFMGFSWGFYKGFLEMILGDV